MDIEISSETFGTLDKYCNELIRPAELSAVMDRILEGWYAKAAREWARRPELIPILEKIPESDTHKVSIGNEHARIYLRTLDNFNKKMDLTIDPCSLADWLARMFIKLYGIVEKNKYRIRMGRIVWMRMVVFSIGFVSRSLVAFLMY